MESEEKEESLERGGESVWGGSKERSSGAAAFPTVTMPEHQGEKESKTEWRGVGNSYSYQLLNSCTEP